MSGDRQSKLGFVVDPATGFEIGQHPDEISRAGLAAMGHSQRSLLKIIRTKCYECSSGSVAEVRKCPVVNCPLWPLRFGVRPKAWRSTHVGTAVRPIRKPNR
jgi:hypothetical protein